MTAQLTPQQSWHDSVIRIDWALDTDGSFDCNPSDPNLNQEVLGQFPGWFKVTNLVNLPLTNVSIEISVSENARTWDVSLQSHDQGEENDRTVLIGDIAANGQSAQVPFKWQVAHAGVRFDWDQFPVNLELTPAYTVSYQVGWGPVTTLRGEPVEANS